MSLRQIVPLIVVLCLAVPLLAQESNRGTAEATVNSKKVSINYGRPSLKGRDMLAKAEVGTVWRVGMNQATEIESTGDLVVAGKELKAGKYSLWVKKTGPDTWILAFHPKTGIWGAPPLREGYIAELPLKLEKTADSAEQLAINLVGKDDNAEILIHWGTAMLSGSFGVK